MGQSTGKSVKGGDTGKAAEKSAEELRREIAQTREKLASTAGAIEQTLPQTIKEKAQEAAADMKHIAADAIDHAKHAAVEGFQETKAAVRQEVSEQVREAKYAVRRATIGRVETMVHRASDNVSDASGSIIDTIKANPIPAALVGVGLAWLFMGRSRSAEPRATMRSARHRYVDSHGYPLVEDEQPGPDYAHYGPHYGAHYGFDHEEQEAGMIDRGREAVRGGARRVRGAVGEGVDRVRGAVDERAHGASEMAHDLGDRVQGAASSARRAAGDLAEHTGERAQALAIRAQREARYLGREASLRARQAERGVARIYEENPLAVGAALVAVGAMVGLALPHTEREDELMGTVRDRLVGQAEQLASGAVEKVNEVAKERLAPNGNGTGTAARY